MCTRIDNRRPHLDWKLLSTPWSNRILWPHNPWTGISMMVSQLNYTVLLKCNVVSHQWEGLKNLLIKGRGTYFACDYTNRKQNRCHTLKIISKFFLSLAIAWGDVKFELYHSSIKCNLWLNIKQWSVVSHCYVCSYLLWQWLFHRTTGMRIARWFCTILSSQRSWKSNQAIAWELSKQ